LIRVRAEADYELPVECIGAARDGDGVDRPGGLSDRMSGGARGGSNGSPVQVAAQGPEPDKALALLLRGAMGASGSKPDEATQIAFGKALAAEAAGAEAWHSEWSDKPAAPSRTLTADIVRQIPSIKYAGKIDMYRLILTCGVDTHEGEIRLAWANGVPDEGHLFTVAVDETSSFTHKAEGGKKQGNGAYGPGATILYPGAGDAAAASRAEFDYP
jgi:hypothetical protein